MIGLYTNARHLMAYSDGEVRRQFNVCLTAHIVGGALAISDESTHVRWGDREEIGALSMPDTRRLRIEHFFRGTPAPTSDEASSLESC